jgi:hypothetical protein
MRPARAGQWLALCLMAAVGAGTGPGVAAAQDTDGARRRVEFRAGLAGHRAEICSRRGVTGGGVGLALSTSGRWFGSTAVDYFFGGQPDACIDLEFVTQYRGQNVRLRSGSEIGFRPSAAFGYRLPRQRLEITGAVGTLPTRTDFAESGADDVSWRLWFGTALTYRLASGMGLQSEIGLHQVPERYLAMTEDVIVADEIYWEPMWRIAFSIPII